MDIRTRRALVRFVGAAVVVLGVFLTATAVRRADQVVASGREVLLGGEVVDVFTARDLRVGGHARLTGTAVALGDLAVPQGSLRIDRTDERLFAVGGSVVVGEAASVVFPAAGALKYGTIRSGDDGGADTVLRDRETVARYGRMVAALEASAICFARTASTGIVLRSERGITFVGDGASGLQVFNVDGSLAGPITVSRVPRDASVLVNVTGSAVEIAPTGSDWDTIAPRTLVNVADAVSIEVDAGDALRLNALVGSTGGAMSLTGGLVTGTVLSLSSVELGDVQVAGGPLLASLLPDCDALLEPPVDEIATPSWTPPVAHGEATISTSTSTTTTTTTTALAGVVERGARPVPGAAFALGGAATASHWWLGLPIALVGVVLLGWSWLEHTVRVRRAAFRRRRALARVHRRLARHG